MRALTLGTLFRKDLVTEELVRARHEMSIGKNQEAAQIAARCQTAAAAVQRIGQLKKKTLLLWGAQDRGVSVERGILLFQLIPNAEFHLFDRCAHWVQWDQADRFNALVSDFLKMD